jgi:photosystem II stability/assembly factor-like uncharacterized protein
VQSILLNAGLTAATLLASAARAADLVQTNGPVGGRVTAIISTGLELVAGTRESGLLRSSDNGDTWQRVAASNLDLLAISQLAAVPGLIIAGTEANGAFASTDSGTTWTAIARGLTGLRIIQLHARGKDIFALAPTEFSSFSGLPHRWDASAGAWQVFESAPYMIQFVATANALMGTSDAGAGVFRSIDDGLTWDLLVPIGPTGGSPDAYIVVDGVVDAASGFSNIYRSADDGDTWVDMSDGLPADSHITVLGAKGPVRFAHDYGEVYRAVTDSSTITWEPASTGLASGEGIRISGFTEHGAWLLAGTGRGVYRTDNLGDAWQSANDGFVASRVMALATQGATVFVAVASTPSLVTSHDVVFRSTDGGNTWTESSAGLPVLCNITALAAHATSVFAGTFRNGVFRSDDGGLTWTAASDGLPTYPSNGGFLHFEVGQLLAIDGIVIGTIQPKFSQPDHGNGITQGGGVYRSLDGGQTWTAVNNGIPLLGVNNPPFSYQHRPRSVGLSEAGGSIFLGTQKHGVFRSTNNGDSWTAVNAGLPQDSSGLWPQLTSFIAHDQGTFASSIGFWLGGSPSETGVFVSADGGTTWASAAAPVQGRPVNALVQTCGNLFAAVGPPLQDPNGQVALDDGVYRSTNGGASWQLLNAPVTDVGVSTLALGLDQLFAGTLGFGVWRAAVPCAPTSGDATGDGQVNIDDLLAIINAWGACAACAPGACPADVTGNCVVDIDDLLMVINNWG